MTCLICRRPLYPEETAIGMTDCCTGCEHLCRGDRLMKDAYVSRGGTFAGLTAIKPPSWRHGTVNGYRRHNCHCDACTAANSAEKRRQNRAAGRTAA